MDIVDEFYSWVAHNHPGVELNERTVETKLSSNPRMGFKRLFQLAKISVENTSAKIKVVEKQTPPNVEDQKLLCFKEWLVDNNLSTDAEEWMIKDMIKTEPELNAQQLYDVLSLTSVIVDVMEEEIENITPTPALNIEEDTMSDNTNNNDENIVTYSVELANSTEEPTGIKKHLQDTSEDVVSLVSGWAESHPKTATAVGIGTVALAGYGAYKLAQKIF